MRSCEHTQGWARRAIRFWATAAAAVALLTLSACGGDDKGTESGLPSEYKIGANMGLTGAIAPYDKPALDGFRMAVDEINAHGGIGGKSKITLSIENNRSEAAKSAEVAQTFASDGVNFMVAPGDASIAIPAGKVAQAHDIPTMSILASTPTIRSAVGEHFFSNASADNLVAAGLAKYATEKGIKTAWVIAGPDTPFTQLWPKYFQQAFETDGGKVVGTDTYKLGTQDFSPQIGKIRDLDPQPDAIATPMYEPEFPAFLKQLRAAGVDIPILATDAIDTPATLGLGDLIDGTLAVTYGFPTPGDALDDFYKRYEKHYGEPPPAVFPAIGFDAAHIIADAVERAGTADPAAVLKAVNDTRDYKGVAGATTYGSPSLPGFPVRPVTVQQWRYDAASGKVKRKLLDTLSLEADQIPAG